MIKNNNIVKYLIMFLVTTLSTKLIPTCGVLREHAIYVGFISSSTFALLDMCSPSISIQREQLDNLNTRDKLPF